MAHISRLLGICCLGATFVSGLAVAQSVAHQQPPSLDQLRRMISNSSPQTTATKVDHERLTVRRLDVVDDNGVIRVVLAGEVPEPIIDGIQYKRAFQPAGITFYDEDGSEKGGAGTGPGGIAVSAMDYPNSDAVGWRVLPDGSAMIALNQRPPQVRVREFGNKLVPMPAPTRLKLAVTPDGAPSIELTDKQARPRLRLLVNDSGEGAIEFLDAEGRVVQNFVPEATARVGK